MRLVIQQLLAFIRNTLIEALRNKTFFVLLFFGLLAIGATSTFGALSLHQAERVFYNLVLFSNVLFLAFLAIYHGVGALWREIDTKTIFTVLSKPVHRATFLVGKYVAVVGVMFFALLVLLGLKVLVALTLGYTVPTALFATYYGVFLQLAIVVSMSIFFTSFSTQLLSALFTFSLFVAGNLTPQLRDASEAFAHESNPIHYMLEVALFVLPDLEKLNLAFELTHRLEIPFTYLLQATAYTAVYVTVLLTGAHFIFRQRDFS